YRVGPVTQMFVTQQPTRSRSESVLATSINLRAADSEGYTNTNYANPVALTITAQPDITNGAFFSLTNTYEKYFASGIVSFDAVSIKGKVGSYTLRAETTNYDNGYHPEWVIRKAPDAFDLWAAPATHFVLTNDVANPIYNDANFSLGVEARDDSENVDLTYTQDIKVKVLSGSGTLRGTNTTSGVATLAGSAGAQTFSGLQVRGIEGSDYQLQVYGNKAAGGSMGTDETNIFTLLRSTGSYLQIDGTPPTTGENRQTLDPITVGLYDTGTNNITAATHEVRVAIYSGPNGTVSPGGTLSGTTAKTLSGGKVTFSDLKISGKAGDYVLQFTDFTDGTVTLVRTSAITISPTHATKLYYYNQATAARSGIKFTTDADTNIVVQALDPDNNVDKNFSGQVSIAYISGATTDSLSGTLSANASQGVATFDNLTLTGTSGLYQLRASTTVFSGDTVWMDSGNINLTYGNAAKLAVTSVPSTANNRAAFGSDVTVEVQDSAGNKVANSSASVSIVVKTGDSGTLVSGSSTLTKNAVNGVATFTASDLSLTGVSIADSNSTTSVRLTASSGLLTTGDSAGIAVSAGAAHRLTIESDPVPPITVKNGATLGSIAVAARDQDGNLRRDFSGSMVAALVTNSGQPGATLGGTTTVSSGSNGIYTFSNLAITGKVDIDYQIVFTSAGVTGDGDTTGFIEVTPGNATHLVIADGAPTTGTVASALGSFTIQALDASDNIDTNFDTGTIGVTYASGLTATAVSDGAGTNSVPLLDGEATFSNIILTGTIGTYTLDFDYSGSGVTGITSDDIELSAGSPVDVAITTQPTRAISGTAFGTDVTVETQDAGGNISNSTDTVTLSASTFGTLTGTNSDAGVASHALVAGTYTFSGLILSGDAGTYTLEAVTGAYSDFSSNIRLDTPATFGTISTSNLTNTSASVEVTNVVGNDSVDSTDLTFEYSLDNFDTIDTATSISDPLDLGASETFDGTTVTTAATGLSPGTHYWVRLKAVNSAGTSYSDVSNFWLAPTLTSVSPDHAPLAGGSVTLTGSGFDVLRELSYTVKFGTEIATNVVVNSATSMTVTAPAQAASGLVAVTIEDDGGATFTTSSTFFNYIDAPTIDVITPDFGPVQGGNDITITGTGLLWDSNDMPLLPPTVTIDGQTATYVSFDSVNQELVVTVPAASDLSTKVNQSVDVVVENWDGQTAMSTGGYTYKAGAPHHLDLDWTVTDLRSGIQADGQPKITVRDVSENKVDWYTGSVTVSRFAGDADLVLSGESVASSLDGDFQFSTLTLTGKADTYTLRFVLDSPYGNIRIDESNL
ncbi:MAG: hypothetical protein F2839_06010, partial [Actinobacteria bacterium]|nr:hypothetical protein [Actinomycetota bacterium]